MDKTKRISWIPHLHYGSADGGPGARAGTSVGGTRAEGTWADKDATPSIASVASAG